jgi:polyisoprenoid-binding protein YceI
MGASLREFTRVIEGVRRSALTPPARKLPTMSTLEQTPVTSWQIDTVHSTVGFAVKHMIVSTFRGAFETYDATLTDAGGDLSLSGWVDVSSIVVKDPNLGAHLASPEFFDAERHPRMRFASHSIEVADDGAVTLVGELELKGHTGVVRATGTATPAVSDPFGGVRRGVELEAVVDRREYGLEWNMALPKGGLALGHDVRLLINLEFTQA